MMNVLSAVVSAVGVCVRAGLEPWAEIFMG